MTYRDIFQDVARRTDKNADNPDPVTQGRLNLFINDRYRELMRLPGLIDLRDESFSFTSESGRARYPIPVSATAITSVVDTAHRLTLQNRTLAWIRQRDASVPAQSSGTPFVYAILNASGIGQQPAIVTASALELVSTSAADTGVVNVEYQDDNGGFREIAVTLTGTTPVTVAATCVQVFRITYQLSPVGAITLRQIVGALPIAVLPATSLPQPTGNLHSSRNWVLHLWPTPSGAFTYTVDGSRPRAALVDAMDEPALPEDFHTLLVWGACEDELLKMDDTRRGDYAERWAKDVRALRAFLHQSRGQRYVRDRSRRVGWTPMGSNYPPWQ